MTTTVLPFDMEKILKDIRDTSKVRELYNQMLKRQLTDSSFLDGISVSVNVKKDDERTVNDVKSVIASLKKYLRLLPCNTLYRNHLAVLSILDTHWFRHDATYANINDETLFPDGPLTDHLTEAASEFSLPWGMATLLDSNPYKSVITMYMPVETYPVFVIDIYLAYTFFHELGHVFSNAAYYSLYYANKFLGIEHPLDKRNAYILKLQNGTQVSGNTYIESFASLVEQYGPFGTYTAGYKKGDDETVWLLESFADATAAYFLGFMMYPEKDFAPLHPAVYQYMHDFYHADAIIKK